MATDGLRLLVYDRTCRGAGGRPLGLSHTWQAGGWLYRALDRLDATIGVERWDDALTWLAEVEPDRPIAEIQYWGHGKWGQVLVAGAPLDRSALDPDSERGARLAAIRARLVPDGRALWWFRTCETFGARAGHDLARAWTDFFGCRAAGHTYIIGYYQSGLHALCAGDPIDWPDDEGLAEGTAEEPLQALWSRRGAPNTISCLQGTIPETCWVGHDDDQG